MNPSTPLLAATRAALESTYGLALEGLGDEQIENAVYAAASAGMADARDPAYLSRVVDRLPIDESWLFRDDALWEWLRDKAGPELLEGAAIAGRPVRIHSLGCSSGQEPFTAAMLFQDLLERIGLPPSATSAYVQVVGMDSSPFRIEAARSGLVPSWSVQRCRDGWLRGRVVPEPATLARYRIASSVQAACRFEQGNLVDVALRGNGALGGYDLVLCRNVLIYFRPAEAARLASQLARGLDPGAYLAFSATEAHLIDTEVLELAGQLGIGRASSRSSTRAPRPRRAPRPSQGPPKPPPGRAPPLRAVPSERPARDDAVAAHLEKALRHAQAGDAAEALREVRAALLHDPRHLYSRLLLGQQLIPMDERRGREVLQELVDTAARMPADQAVPCAEGLSVGQLAAAARILLSRREQA